MSIDGGGAEGSQRRRFVTLYLNAVQETKVQNYCKTKKCFLRDGRPNYGKAIREMLDRVELVETIKQAPRAEVKREVSLRIVE